MGYRELSVGKGLTEYIEIADGGYFYVDFYIHNDEVEFAATAYVWRAWIPTMKGRLSASTGVRIETDDELLDVVAKRLGSLTEVKDWLTANRIPYGYRYDDGARDGATEGLLPDEPAGPPPSPRLRVVG